MFLLFGGTPNSVSVNRQMFLQSFNVDINDGCKHICSPQYSGLHLNLSTWHLSALFRAALRSLESSSSLTFTHGLREPGQVLTWLLFANPSPDLLSCPTGTVIGVSSLLFVCIQSLYVIYLKRSSDHSHANNS